MTHSITIGPSAAQLVDADGKVSPLPKPRPNVCGWRSAERATAEQATIDGRAHIRLAVRSESVR